MKKYEIGEEKKERASTRNFEASLKTKYGISIDQHNELLVMQNCVCGICGGVDNARLAVDHDHSSGRVRGLLCRGCNIGIGNFKENVDVMNKAVEYLRFHNNG